MKNWVEYIPLITTVFSTFFFVELFGHYRLRKKKYLLWWSLGVLTFGLGTLAESINVLWGWSAANLRYWYITGALLGGFPLAQGSVYLLMNKKFADITTLFFSLLIVTASVCVIMSPIALPEGFDGKLTGKVFEWTWVRSFSPVINIYSFLFLVGGALYSARKYFKEPDKSKRFIGNVYIAVGGLLPGIGGSFTRAGYVNVLFVTELIGLFLIFIGYRIIKSDKQVAAQSGTGNN
ncbi:MAG TPA: hypothetical protein VFW78_02230 [Bacteroidia bacterium]|nr:hypothetical protein [Bacteroidia bacterium]